MDEKDKEIALLKHQLNRLRCFMWLHKTNFKTRRKMTNIDIWDYFNKKDPKQLKKQVDESQPFYYICCMSDKYKQYYDTWQIQEENQLSYAIDSYDYVDVECIFKDRTSSILSVNWIDNGYSWTDNDGNEIYDEYCDFELTDEDGNSVYEDDIVYWRLHSERCV